VAGSGRFRELPRKYGNFPLRLHRAARATSDFGCIDAIARDASTPLRLFQRGAKK